MKAKKTIIVQERMGNAMKRTHKYTALSLILLLTLLAWVGYTMGDERESGARIDATGIDAKLIAAYEKVDEIHSYLAQYRHDYGISEATQFEVTMTVENDVAGDVRALLDYAGSFWHYTDLVYKPYTEGQYYFTGKRDMYHYESLQPDNDRIDLTYDINIDKQLTIKEGVYRQIFTHLGIESFSEMAQRFAQQDVFAVATEDGYAYALKDSYFDMLCIFMGQEAKRAREEMESMNDEATILRENMRYETECELTFYITSDGILSGIYFNVGENDVARVNYGHFYRNLCFKMSEINKEHIPDVPNWAKGELNWYMAMENGKMVFKYTNLKFSENR